MTIDNKTINDIARLARLEVSPEQADQYQQELSNILDLVATMEACDTAGIEPMTHPFDATLRLREDEITAQNEREKYQSVAPQAEEGYYLVPRVID